MTDSISELKAQLRQRCRQERDNLPETYRQHASDLICQKIAEWKKFQFSSFILVYLPMNSEVNLLPLVQTQPKKHWLAPRILPGGEMVVHPYRPARLIRHRFGMLEPDPSLPLFPPEHVDLVLVPGLAFDLDGWRLGYGGGYFDRFLSANKACTSLGITFQALMQSSLPHQEFDVRMKYLVTEDGVRQIPSKPEN